MARIISRMRAAGWLHSIEKRFVMCGLIWLPSPRMKRPCDAICRSHAVLASVIGLRAKATAIDVPSSRFDVASEAGTSGRNGSWLVSAVQPPEYPAFSSSAAWAPALLMMLGMPPSTFMAANVGHHKGAPPPWTPQEEDRRRHVARSPAET